MKLAERYTAAIRSVRGLEPPFVPAYARTNFQSYAVRVGPQYPITRDALTHALLDAGASTRRVPS